MTNRLSASTSDYLRQHASNPIDWWSWGPEAFAEAARRDVPVLVSVGYSACHWCHVMAHETFEDADVAAFVNEHFVAIKVDREERPDVDAVLMRATQALTGQGGWPMTVFTTPAGEPFFAGTYYPPEPRGGMPSFMQLVGALAEAWASRRDEVLASASAIVGQLAQLNAVAPASGKPDVWELMDAVSADFDLLHGGFGQAPKFPAPALVEALLVKGEPSSVDLAQRTLEAMARGGIHDQVGGGFHRYSVDAGWVVPHFEKMLYDNAQLLGAYTQGWRRTPSDLPALRDLFERVVRGIVAWVEREMVTDGGGFAASLDADSADIRGMAHEGIYYVWNPDLLTDALGEEDADWAAQTFHVTNQGTFEHGLSTLQLRGAPDVERLQRVSERLLEVRSNRFAPPRDDKVITSWNGLLIDALVGAALIFDEPGWLELARRAAEAVWRHWVDGSLRHASQGGVVSEVDGFADDYGAAALAFGRLAGALGESVWLERAVQVLEAALARFAADDGGFFDAVADESLFERPRDLSDNPTPSGTVSLVRALRYVGLMAGRPEFEARAEQAVATTWSVVGESPRNAPASFAELLLADEMRKGLSPAVAVVIDEAGDPCNMGARACWRMAPVGTVIVSGRPGTAGFAHHFEGRGPLVERSPEGDGFASPVERSPEGEVETKITSASVGPGGLVKVNDDDSEYAEHEIVPTDQTVYVCRGETCFAPASTVQEIRTALWMRA